MKHRLVRRTTKHFEGGINFLVGLYGRAWPLGAGPSTDGSTPPTPGQPLASVEKGVRLACDCLPAIRMPPYAGSESFLQPPLPGDEICTGRRNDFRSACVRRHQEPGLQGCGKLSLCCVSVRLCGHVQEINWSKSLTMSGSAGSTLYTVFEVQAWISLAVGGLLSFNLLLPTDQPSIARMLGCAALLSHGIF